MLWRAVAGLLVLAARTCPAEKVEELQSSAELQFLRQGGALLHYVTYRKSLEDYSFGLTQLGLDESARKYFTDALRADFQYSGKETARFWFKTDLYHLYDLIKARMHHGIANLRANVETALKDLPAFNVEVANAKKNFLLTNTPSQVTHVLETAFYAHPHKKAKNLEKGACKVEQTLTMYKSERHFLYTTNGRRYVVNRRQKLERLVNLTVNPCSAHLPAIHELEAPSDGESVTAGARRSKRTGSGVSDAGKFAA